jgi:uncharacterized protein (TIGR00304 family)
MTFLTIAGLLLIALGLALMFWPRPNGREKRQREEEISEKSRNDAHETTGGKCQIRGGGVIMLGPIPIVFGSDPRTAAMLMLLAMAMMAIWLLAYWRQ